MKGTPNKENPLKGYIRSHSMTYFEPRPRKREETGEEFLLHIRDQGKGISIENQERIFQRFFRVEKSELIEGFGLGLSLVKRIAEKHQGSVTVESEPGVGSTFTLHLPRVLTH